MSDIIPQKRCTKCNHEFPPTLEHFGSQKTVKSGLRSICKICQKAYDATRASVKNERRKERRRTDPAYAEYMREKDRQFIKVHADVISLRKKAYYDAHPEQRRVEAHRRRAREREVGGTHTAQDEIDQYQRQKGKCYYCHQKLNGVYEIDHVIPIARGGTNDKWNIVAACPVCNARKSNKLPHEWIQGGRLL